MKIDNLRLYFPIVLFLYVGMLLFFNRDSYVYISGQYVVRENGFHYLYYNIFRFFVGLTGCVVFCVATKWVYDYTLKGGIWAVLVLLGQCSLGIYCIQERAFSIFKRFVITNIDSPGVDNTILTCLLVMIVSFIGTYVLKSCRLTNILFLGGR